MLIDDRGRVAEVGPDDSVPHPADAQSAHLADAALIPGFVNTHTHLELTGFAGMNENDDFWEWIKRIIALKATRNEDDFLAAAQDGIRQCWAAGVTTIADMGNTGSVVAAMHELGASGIAYHEAFDIHVEDPEAVAKRFTGELERLAAHATGRVTLGVSPHAPYTVSPQLYRRVGEIARAHGAPIGVHIAEPQDETALLRDFTGIFANFLRERGVAPLTTEPVSPVAWLDRHGILSPRTLCAHAIHADVADTRLLREHDCAVAHCPRSNRRHHGETAPIAMFLDHGLRMGMGTDSEVSVAPLDLLAEARDAALRAGWSAAETLRAVTLDGANALGLASETGSITPGKWADLAAIAVAETDRPEAAVVASGLGDVVGTWVGGVRRWALGVGR